MRVKIDGLLPLTKWGDMFRTVISAVREDAAEARLDARRLHATAVTLHLTLVFHTTASPDSTPVRMLRESTRTLGLAMQEEADYGDPGPARH